jgi:putative FmdB family regulatory protein
MPLYEYECDACGERFEKIVKFSDPPLEVCAKCGKGPIHKLVSSPAIQFKGSGWYITDYAKKSSPAAGKDTKESKDAQASKESKDTKEPAKSSDSSSKPSGSKAD